MKTIIYLISLTSIVFNMEKLFVACEGHYYGGQGTVSIIEDLNVMSEITDLGNTVQSVTVHENYLFVISNGAHQIHIFIINENSQELIETINTNNSSPRNMLIHNNLAYFTNWNSMDIKIMNLDTFEIIGSIPVNGMPEDIITDGQNIWVSITMNADWTDGNTVIKLNPENWDITEYEVGYGPGDLVFHDGAVYVSRTYYDQNWNTFYGTSKIDSNGQIIQTEYGNGIACGGSLTKHSNTVYRSYDGGIAPLDDELNILSEQKIGNFNFENLYDVKSINNKIYFALTDYVDLNQVAILDQFGDEINRFDVGVIPTDFAIWDNTLLGSQINQSFDFVISKSYPNPFNPNTTLTINVPESGYLSVKIYDVNGKIVDTVTSDFYTKNRYNFTWNASNMASGLYMVIADLNGYSISKQITLIK
mgnify:CR=1 FL=1